MIALIALSLIYTTRTIFLPSPPPPFSPADRIDYSLPTRPNPLPSSYSPPHDLVLPSPPLNGIPPESRIGKISILFNDKDPTLVRALQMHEAHNRHFGYSLLLLRHDLLDGGTLDGIWNKPAYVLAALLEEMRKPAAERLQWLFWHDADTILLNPLIPLTLFLPPPSHPHVHLLLTADPHGLNNGVFFLRVHAWSISLFAAVLAHPTYRPTMPLPYRDQSALGLLLNSSVAYGAHFLTLPQRWFNAYAGELDDAWTHAFQVRRGDLLVHFTGCPKGERERVMGPWLQRAEGRGKEWVVEVGGTSLNGELERFWREREAWLGREREEARKEVGETMGRVEGWVGVYRGRVTGEEEAAVAGAGEKVKEALVGGEVPEVVREALEELETVVQPYRILAEQDQKALTKDAHAAVVEAERIMLGSPTAEPEVTQTLQRMLERLRALLVRESDDVGMIKECMDHLREARDSTIQREGARYVRAFQLL
ncbi:hypothetical protein MMC17_003488 [Xylographa soralifera]|nr:hypothetical protein [Xylographa soralifera]